MTAAVEPPTGGVTSAAADSRDDKEATMAADRADIDEQALVLRRQSKGFRTIAAALGLPGANDANKAFNRALRRRTADEQATIRSEEHGRLDRLRDAVAADKKRSEEENAKRLHAIERLRSRLMSD